MSRQEQIERLAALTFFADYVELWQKTDDTLLLVLQEFPEDNFDALSIVDIIDAPEFLITIKGKRL